MIYKGMVCQWCGATFTAQKSNTKYCSKRCAEHANKQRMRKMAQGIVDAHNEEKQRSLKAESEVLSPKALADYLGVCKSTIYNYLNRKLFPVLQSSGRTFIRKKDVDAVFDSAPPYCKRKSDGKGKKDAADATLIPSGDDSIKGGSSVSKGGKNVSCGNDEKYTTVKEIAQRYGLSLSGTDKLLKESGLTIIRHRGKNYYFLREVEALFRRREADSHPEISEWYTCAEIQEKFNLKPTSIYDIASSFNIPTKKVRNVTYYSKVHFDMARGIKPADSEMWYTVQEAMDRYGQTRDQVYNVLRYNNIQRVQVGRNVKFRRCDYDEAMKFSVISKD
ncbi:MAG: helix-turn-helix domain-containing protein [Candidatus Cryptobacteroides sp.]